MASCCCTCRWQQLRDPRLTHLAHEGGSHTGGKAQLGLGIQQGFNDTIVATLDRLQPAEATGHKRSLWGKKNPQRCAAGWQQMRSRCFCARGNSKAPRKITHSALLPNASTTLGSAPCVSRKRTAFSWPTCEATITAVRLL